MSGAAARTGNLKEKDRNIYRKRILVHEMAIAKKTKNRETQKIIQSYRNASRNSKYMDTYIL